LITKEMSVPVLDATFDQYKEVIDSLETVAPSAQ